MADTPQAECQAEQTSEQPESLPSKALYMDLETALHRTKALFGAIRAMGSFGLGKDDLGHIIDLAALGESIIEDQLSAEE